MGIKKQVINFNSAFLSRLPFHRYKSIIQLHSFQLWRTNPMVCWVSRLKRKQEVKPMMLSTQGMCSSPLSSSRSPWVRTTRYQITANTDQEIRNEVAKLSNVHDQGRSIMEVKKSFRNLKLKL